jgi:hypothetical protein
MTLICKTEVTHTVQYYDLENFIREETGIKDFEVLADLECSNDTALRWGITGQDILDFQREDFQEFKAGKPKQYMTRCIVENLCAEGKIAPGTYVINISW